MSTGQGFAAVAAGAAILLIAILLADRLTRIHAEVMRKLVHVVTGSLSATLPWVFAEVWPVLLLAGISAGAMIAMRVVPAWLRWIKRVGFAKTLRLDSWGDITFPPAIAGLFLLAHTRPLLYVTPLLVATFGDAAAAVVGKKWGRHRFTTPFGERKSVEGSVAFALAAYACFAMPLGLDAGAVGAGIIAISLGGALLTAGIEAVAWSGLDNLFLPFGAWLYLRLFIR